MSQSPTLFLDTCVSNHMFNNKHYFENLQQDHQMNVATGCEQSTLTTRGKGLAKLYDKLGSWWLLPNSLYVPELTANLLALSTIAQNKTQIRRAKSQFEIFTDRNTKPPFICQISSGVLETQINFPTSHCLHTQGKENGDLWHKKLGHMNKFDMKKLTISVMN
ncbi:hypothetical protein O181_096245 [Austropuccinia psidii MF-1]|uniref:Retrovirus-related Pol polyprotein from transposon TNT 1-94-like beta-barrel domain-containing protein n=1 Tax=Austropuccinia psidii MF-1 TaxID=1389203 RepID=A0A9Q3J5B3_9BASI|nr:hypothetical protein [Austropuccinia psidii MF-1]